MRSRATNPWPWAMLPLTRYPQPVDRQLRQVDANRLLALLDLRYRSHAISIEELGCNSADVTEIFEKELSLEEEAGKYFWGLLD